MMGEMNGRHKKPMYYFYQDSCSLLLKNRGLNLKLKKTLLKEKHLLLPFITHIYAHVRVNAASLYTFLLNSLLCTSLKFVNLVV